ncbi:ROK family protein [Porticoccaceae bacterium]|nr:ROK family protein [Porticoccaceae bacterium]MDB9999742.1 ROK family protein [Porticoccaceae bacterium]
MAGTIPSKLYAGIEAGGTKFNCVIGTDPQTILKRTKIATTTPEVTLVEVKDWFVQQSLELGPFSALGIACFGPLDLQPASPTYGHIMATPKPHWSNTDVAGYFQDKFNVPVGFDTDVNGSAMGEHLYGAGQNISDFVYVTVGTGIGAGIFVNGELLKGMVHSELGHIRLPRDLDKDSYTGNCSFHGDCLTGLAAGPAINARWNCSGSALPEDHPAWDLEADYLALMCFNIVMSYSPKRIILGGGVMDQRHLFPLIRRKIFQLLNNFMLPETPLDDYIVPPGLPGTSGEVGALALAINAEFGLR